MAKPQEDSYRKITQVQHVLEKPEFYGVSVSPAPRQAWVADFGGPAPRLVRREVSTPTGVERVFLEILSNAFDEHRKSRLAGVEPGDVVVNVGAQEVEVQSGGRGIAVEVHAPTGLHNPELLFGTLLTSSNYEAEKARMGSGTNGVGCKLTNIYSRRFAVEVADPRRHLAYAQEWRANMSERGEPEICPYDGAEAAVRVVYELDFARFGYAEPRYRAEDVGLMGAHVAGMAFAARNRAVFNGAVFDLGSAADFARLAFPPEAVATGMALSVAYEVEVGGGAPQPALLEALVMDTPDAAEVISFVNAMPTPRGGAHVERILKLTSDEALARLKPPAERAATAARARAAPAPAPAARLTLADVRPHVSAVVSFAVPNPNQGANVKDFLKEPAPLIAALGREAQVIGRWQLLNVLREALAAKDRRRLGDTDGRKARFINEKVGQPANFAGTKRAHECTLLVVEGLSAMGYAAYAIDNIEGGHDFTGVFPLRGKPLNVTGLEAARILDNEEIANLKKALGLRDSVGENGAGYALDENYFSLRYGRVVIMADADDDGKHITALVINIFHNHYRGLLQRGCVAFFRSPIIRVSRGKSRRSFFSDAEFEAWSRATPDAAAWRAKYFKGLGSSNEDDVAEDFRAPVYVTCLYDDATPATMRLAFDPALADERKRWLARWERFTGTDEMRAEAISTFINRELIIYARRSVQRALPALLDGFKDAQRKILFGALGHWGTRAGLWPERAPDESATAKVLDLASEVSALTHYRHGPNSMTEAIVGMASDVVGVQNLPFLVPDGNFGTRNYGGRDHAAPRYLSTYPQSWVPACFRNEDLPILEPNEEEGAKIEPRRFLPIVPLCLVNGAEGIATGWRTFVPCHNPRDVVAWLRARISGGPLPPLVPWYRGFAGDIRVEKALPQPLRRANRDDFGARADADLAPPGLAADGTFVDEAAALASESASSSPSPAPLAAAAAPRAAGLSVCPAADDAAEVGVVDGGVTMVTTGRFSVQVVKERARERTVVEVTELPFRSWTAKYLKRLERQVAQHEISDFADHSAVASVRIEIRGMVDPSVENLALRRAFGLSTMILLDEDGAPRRFSSAAEIAEAFYISRLPFYERRRQHQLAAARAEADRAQAKIRFVEAVNEGRLVFRDRPLEEVKAQMAQMNIPPELADHTPTASLARDRLGELATELKKHRDAAAFYEARSPGQLWLADLADFEKAYDAWLAGAAAREAKRQKRKAGRAATAAKAQEKANGKAGEKPSRRATAPKASSVARPKKVAS